MGPNGMSLMLGSRSHLTFLHNPSHPVPFSDQILTVTAHLRGNLLIWFKSLHQLSLNFYGRVLAKSFQDLRKMNKRTPLPTL